MPKETFSNLSPEKQRRFIEAALQEFSTHNFDQASVTQIVKQLGIAKGSVYQYFNDKLDLWLYLKSHCELRKLAFIEKINRDDFPDFWSYYRQMYRDGIRFDLEEPLCSQFLYRVGFKENSEAVRHHLDSWKKQALVFLTRMVEEEKKRGTFSKKISTASSAHFLLSMSLSIAELLRNHYAVDFDGNLEKGKPLFGKNEKELMAAADELILLLKKALQP